MVNGTMMQYFHWYYPADGSLWKQVKEKAQEIASMGITALWLPPAYKGKEGGSTPGYDVYDLYDLGEFDQKGSIRTKYGTKEEYVEAVKALHEKGIQVIVDIVLNHKGGADEKERIKVFRVDPDNRNVFLGGAFDIDAYTKFTFPGRGGKYSEFIWDSKCFSGVDRIKNSDDKGVYRILNNYGDGWQEMIDDEKGNYDYLMFNDIDFRNESVRIELRRWAKWYFDQVHFDGVRLDAVKHIPYWFYNEWIDNLRKDTGQEIFSVAEYWSPGKTDTLVKYLEATNGRFSLFDATLQQNFHHASRDGKKFDISKIFENTLVKIAPEKTVTVVSNHDTQPLQSLEAPVEAWFKPISYALILLRDQGYPCVFYPDLYGAHYKDKGKDGNEQEVWLQKVENIEKLLQVRCDYAYGAQRDYFDHPNCIGWVREGDDQHSGCAIVISNGDDGNKNMEIGKRYAGRNFVDVLVKRNEEVNINDNGWGNFLAPAGSLSVWIEKI